MPSPSASARKKSQRGATEVPAAVFREMADHSPEMIFCKDVAGRYTYVNRAVGEFFAKPVEKIIGHGPADLFDAEAAEIIAKADRRTLAGEEVHSVRELFIGGRRHLLNVVQKPLCNDADEIIGLFGTARDLNFNRSLSNALIDSERRGKVLLDASPVPIMVLAADGAIEYLNPAFTAVLGYTMQEVSRIEHWWPLAFPEPQEQNRWRQAYANAIHAGHSGHSIALGEWQVHAADGGRRTLIAAFSRAGTQGLLTLQDQTDIRRATAHVREQENLLRSITDSARDAIFVKDLGLRYTFVNPAMTALLGMPAEALVGQKAEDIFGQEDWTTIKAVDSQALSGEIADAVLDLTIQGHRRTLHTVQTPIRADSGEITGITGIVRDVTVQRRIDRMLNLTHFTVEHVTTAVLWLNQKGQVIHANRAACALLGHGLEDLLRTAIVRFIPSLDDAAWRGAWDELEKHRVLLREFELVDRVGGLIPVEVSASHLEYEGQPYACCLITDLRGHRRAQAEFRRLGTAVEQAAESIMITDPDGIIEYVNPAFTNLTGYSRDEAVGRNPRFLKSGRQDEETYRQLWRKLTGGETWRGHLVNRKKDGSLYEEDAVISPVRDAQGKITNYVAVKRDVTQEVAMEQQLRQSQKMEAVGNLAGGVAHDFNNLLMVINNCAKFARDSLATDAPAGTDLDQIMEAGRRASALIRQLLAFSRRQTLSRETEDLGRIVQELEKMLRRLLREDITMEMALPTGACPVRVDVGQIEQVLVNIVVNASDAMPTGGALTIKVVADMPLDATHRRHLAELPPNPDGRFACLSIADTGVGMSAQTSAHIFEPFFTTKGACGTGLGLATVYGIVRQHEGAIGVVSQPGQGSEFFIYLPMDTGVHAISGKVGMPLFRGHETVLLVEDNALVRKVTRRILTDLGYQVLEAEDGVRALALLQARQDPVDLLISDVIMPEMDGITLAAKVHESSLATGIIYISGYPLAVLSEHGLRGSPENLLRKPFSPAELAVLVRKVLDRRRTP